MKIFLVITLIVLSFFSGTLFNSKIIFTDLFKDNHPEKRKAVNLISQAAQVSSDENKGILSERNNILVKAITLASPSVVFIGVTQIRIVRNPLFDDPFFRQFFPPSVSEYRSMGSGVIVTDKGHIVTNYHVIENASKIDVHLPDGRKFEGELLGGDPYTDIAIIKIKGNDFHPVKVSQNDSLLIGEWVAAIGNPFGAIIRDSRPTVTVGVVSAYGRTFTRESGIKYSNMIQTDAAINPGNSGGALVNCEGELIGINTFIISPNGVGNIGLGFAIPVSRVMKTLKEIIQYGRVRPIYTGVSIQNIDPYIANSLGLKDQNGVIVNSIAKKSPGEKIGLKVGDVIIKVNDQEIFDSDAISDVFSQYLPGDKMNLTIIRDRKIKEISMILESRE